MNRGVGCGGEMQRGRDGPSRPPGAAGRSVPGSVPGKDRLSLVVGAHIVQFLLEVRQFGGQFLEALPARNVRHAGAMQEVEEERVDVAYVGMGHKLVHHAADAKEFPETHAGWRIGGGPLPEEKAEEDLPEQLDFFHHIAGRETPQKGHIPVECGNLVNEGLRLVPPGAQRRGKGAGHGVEEGLAECLDGAIFPLGTGPQLHAPPLGHIRRTGFEPVAEFDFAEVS